MPAKRQQPQHDSDIGNFSIVTEWLFDAGVSSRAIALFALLGLYADRETRSCWPSRATLAKRMKTSTKSIDRWSKELERAGAIVITPRNSKSGGQESNMIRITYARPR